MVSGISDNQQSMLYVWFVDHHAEIVHKSDRKLPISNEVVGALAVRSHSHAAASAALFEARIWITPFMNG